MNFSLSLSRVFPLILICSSCSVALSRNHKITVQTQPNNAQVYIDGLKQGDTPIVLVVPKKQTVELRVEKRGYKTVNQFICSKRSNLGEIEKWGGFLLLGFPGLLLGENDGAYTLDAKDLMIRLEKVTP
jgi:hypothetical protein